MNSHFVVGQIGRLLAVFSLPAFLCAMWAFYNDRYEQASLFIVAVAICISVAALFILAVKNHSLEDVGVDETLAVILGGWLSLVLIGTIPFLNLSSHGPVFALFEAISCLTTTGITLVDGERGLPASLLAWRGILHFLGASWSITGAFLLITALSESSARGRISSHETGRMGFRRNSLSSVFLLTSSVLAALASLLAIAFLLAGVPLREAFALSISVATTGVVDSSLNQIPANVFLQIISVFGLGLAMMNTLWITQFAAGQRYGVIPGRESLMVFGQFFLAWLLVSFALNLGPSISVAGQTLSMIATSGLGFEGAETVNQTPLPLLIFLSFIGGSVLSATGGIKAGRFLMISRRVVQEFQIRAQPNSVIHFKQLAVVDRNNAILALWVYLILYAGVILFVAMLFALFGASFADAMRSSAGALTNSAALLDMGWLESPDDQPFVLFLTGLVMLIGRLEVLVFLSLLTRRW